MTVEPSNSADRSWEAAKAGVILLAVVASVGIAWYVDAAFAPLLYAIGLVLALSQLVALAEFVDVASERVVAVLLGLTSVASVALGVTGVFGPYFAAVAAVVAGWLALSAAAAVGDERPSDPVERRIAEGDGPARIEVSILQALVEVLRDGGPVRAETLAAELDLPEQRVDEALDWLVAEGVVTESDDRYRLTAKQHAVRALPETVFDILVRPIRTLVSRR